MVEPGFFKAECPFCGQPVEVPEAVGDDWVTCPNETCGKSFPPLQVRMTADAPPIPVSSPNLLPCPDCALMVSIRTAACPHCGCPIEKTRPPLPPPRLAQPIKHDSPKEVFVLLIKVVVSAVAVIALFIWIGVALSDAENRKNSSVVSEIKDLNITDPATQKKLADAIAGYEALGVFNKIQVYPGDQVWVYVSDRFSNLVMIEDKRLALAIVYSFYQYKASVKFVVLMDTYTGKTVGMYDPRYGLKLD